MSRATQTTAAHSSSRRRFLVFAAALLLPLAFSPRAARSQEIQIDTGAAPNAAHAHRVTLDGDTFTVKAGEPAWIELRFHIAPGLHINSHVPQDETLIPTTFTVDPTPSLHVRHAEWPAGTPFRLEVGAGETLSTYGGDFAVRLQIDPSAKGDAALTGKLRYQACDNASCFPARDLPVHLTIHAR